MARIVRNSILFILVAIVVLVVAIILQHPINFKEQYPDLERTIHELIESRGFSAESHFIKSQNGYVLQAVRIINLTVRDRSSLKPVLLHHGYPCTGAIWLIAANGSLDSSGKYSEPEVSGKIGNSLGFVLASSGYDVWLANSRGNPYSTNHTTLNTEEEPFWHFSLDEIIAFDLPAVIEYIRSKTNQRTIGYVAHSQGTAMMFGLLANQPRYSQIVKPFIAISPVAFFSKVQAPMEFALGQRDRILSWFPRDIFTYAFRKLGIARACTNPLLRDYFCFWGYHVLFGTPKSQMDLNRLPVYIDNALVGSSTRNLIHLLQQRTSLSYFDHGSPELNVQHYGQPHPPLYNYSMINSTDIAIFYLLKDWYLHLDDVQKLRGALKVNFVYEYAVPDESWNHMDLIWGRDVGRQVNERVLELLARY